MSAPRKKSSSAAASRPRAYRGGPPPGHYITDAQKVYLRRLLNEAFAARFETKLRLDPRHLDSLFKTEASAAIAQLVAWKEAGWKRDSEETPDALKGMAKNFWGYKLTKQKEADWNAFEDMTIDLNSADFDVFTSKWGKTLTTANLLAEAGVKHPSKRPMLIKALRVLGYSVEWD